MLSSRNKVDLLQQTGGTSADVVCEQSVIIHCLEGGQDCKRRISQSATLPPSPSNNFWFMEPLRCWVKPTVKGSLCSAVKMRLFQNVLVSLHSSGALHLGQVLSWVTLLMVSVQTLCSLFSIGKWACILNLIQGREKKKKRRKKNKEEEKRTDS